MSERKVFLGDEVDKKHTNRLKHRWGGQTLFEVSVEGFMKVYVEVWAVVRGISEVEKRQ